MYETTLLFLTLLSVSHTESEIIFLLFLFYVTVFSVLFYFSSSFAHSFSHVYRHVCTAHYLFGLASYFVIFVMRSAAVIPFSVQFEEKLFMFK